MVVTGKVLPYDVRDIDDRAIIKTASLREAHRFAVTHCAASGLDTSIWQGDRRLLTYFGWKPTPHNRRVTDEPQNLNRRKGDTK
jgi:hypothetical protein